MIEDNVVQLKRGDVREDGKLFYAYSPRHKEIWLTPEEFEKKKKLQLDYLRKSNTNINGRAIKMFHAAKQRAEKHGGSITITKEWVREKLKVGICELTGIAFDLTPSKTAYRNVASPSLDRIDSKNRNYSPENTRVVLSSVNVALADYTPDEILPVLKKLVKALEKK